MLLTHFARADRGGLDVFIGRWDIYIKTLASKTMEMQYIESYEWALERKIVRGKTQRKPDGSYDLIFATYDEQLDSYPFCIFSSSGAYLTLAPATWDADERVMRWKNPRGFDITFRSECSFSDPDTRRCRLISKDWKGEVLNEAHWIATRRTD